MRRRRNFGARLVEWLHQIFICVDQLAHVIIAGPKYLIFGGYVPNADETISSIVGRQAIAGKRWALCCEWAIDRLMLPFDGWKLGHCRNSVEPLLPF